MCNPVVCLQTDWCTSVGECDTLTESVDAPLNPPTGMTTGEDCGGGRLPDAVVDLDRRIRKFVVGVTLEIFASRRA